MVLVYSDTASPRLQYVIHFLSQYLQLQFELTTDPAIYRASNFCRINYSETSITKDEIWIQPQGLLAQKGIEEIFISCKQHKHNFPIFFKGEGDTGFDLFAAIFYLLSRYEEYLPHQKDSYGRYAVENSIAYKNNFLHHPLINTWLHYFREVLIKKNPALVVPEKAFSFLATYDIDIAWSYKNKGLIRTLGGMAQSISKGDITNIKNRAEVLSGIMEDPYDAYEFLDALHQQYSLRPMYFFLMANKKSRYDKNISLRNRQLKQLVKQHAEKYTIGIHPSWQSGDEPLLISAEKEALEAITKKKINASRQHYIRFTLPQTFRHLIHAGITDDYSMGYGSVNGFRASVAAPFYWYDLEKEQETTLLLHPFCFMEANSFFEQKISAEEASKELLSYYASIKKVGGEMITIWHNNFLGSDKKTVAWKELYAKFIHLVTEDATSAS